VKAAVGLSVAAVFTFSTQSSHSLQGPAAQTYSSSNSSSSSSSSSSGSSSNCIVECCC
jgi:hypothetical protein